MWVVFVCAVWELNERYCIQNISWNILLYTFLECCFHSKGMQVVFWFWLLLLLVLFLNRFRSLRTRLLNLKPNLMHILLIIIEREAIFIYTFIWIRQRFVGLLDCSDYIETSFIFIEMFYMNILLHNFHLDAGLFFHSFVNLNSYDSESFLFFTPHTFLIQIDDIKKKK